MTKRLNASQSTEFTRGICSRSKVIPVLSVFNIEDAIPLARALMEGGVNVVEVTLRTENALQVIEKMSKVENLVVGVGTLLNRQDVENAVKAGAEFGVSPGVTDDLVLACEEEGLPLLGGVSSVSEVMKMFNRGYDFMKFFPAEVSGGVLALKAIGGPLPQVSFCPTGGISRKNADNYLVLENVICVGGSWIATPDMIQKKDWAEIKNQANIATNLGH